MQIVRSTKRIGYVVRIDEKDDWVCIMKRSDPYYKEQPQTYILPQTFIRLAPTMWIGWEKEDLAINEMQRYIKERKVMDPDFENRFEVKIVKIIIKEEDM